MNSLYVSGLSNYSYVRKENPEIIYKNPIPLDRLNKFVGLDSRILEHDNIVQKQAFDQSYKNFWSFVDFNINFPGDSPQELEMSAGFKSLTSLSGTKTSGASKMTYLEAKEKAKQLP